MITNPKTKLGKLDNQTLSFTRDSLLSTPTTKLNNQGWAMLRERIFSWPWSLWTVKVKTKTIRYRRALCNSKGESWPQQILHQSVIITIWQIINSRSMFSRVAENHRLCQRVKLKWGGSSQKHRLNLRHLNLSLLMSLPKSKEWIFKVVTREFSLQDWVKSKGLRWMT